MKNTKNSRDKELHNSRRYMYDAIDKYRGGFLDKKTGRLDEKYLEARVCPVCESAEHRPIFYKNGGRYVVCEKCKMVYVSPVFKDDCLRDYYFNNTSVQAAAHVQESDFYRRIYSAGIDQVQQRANLRSVLDIGCSSGFFLDIARERGLETFGVELNKTEFEISNNKGHTIWNEPLENINFPLKFDGIFLWDVFEHIKDGRGYLEKLARLISPEGVIFMQIPNSGSVAARVLHDKCNMFDGIEHVCLYNPNTIRMLVEQLGFEIVGITSVIDELGPTMNFMSYEDPYFGRFENVAELSFLTAELIHEYLLGYKLQVTLKLRGH